jgi:hypothetical protein
MSEMSDTFTRPSLSGVASGAGVLIRYGFYLIGALVLGAIGLSMMSTYNGRTRTVDDRASFHIAAAALAHLPSRVQVIRNAKLSRLEIQQYGAFHNREVSFSIGLAVPPEGALTFDPAPQLSSLMPRNMSTMTLNVFHDLDTRFGALRASEVRIQNDGQWKQCLTFASRFETPSLFLVGWYCDASGTMPTASSLACMIDKLALDHDLDSPEADAFLHQRAARAPVCGSTPVSQTVDAGVSRRVSPPQRWSAPNATYRGR